jgi:hypothetical protein
MASAIIGHHRPDGIGHHRPSLAGADGSWNGCDLQTGNGKITR